MKKRYAASWGAFVLSSLLAACGGGGGGGGGGFPGVGLPPGGGGDTPQPNPAGAWLTFNPSRVELSLLPNSPTSFNVVATSTKVISAPVNVAIIDTKGVITNQTRISSSGLTYTATLNTNPALAAGTHTGNFEIRVCYDANPLVCSQPVEGSPWQLPYKITVADPASLHYARWETVIEIGPSFRDNFALSHRNDAPVVVTAGTYASQMATWTSANLGNSWTEVPTSRLPPLSRDFALASDGNAVYLSGGDEPMDPNNHLSHVWKFDGTNWTQKTAAAEFPGRSGHVMAKVGNALYVVAGSTTAGDMRNVWRSDNDGANWSQVASSLPADLGKPTCALNWKGSLLVVGDRVATSTDGATFTLTGGYPETFPKGSTQCAVLDNRLYISPSDNILKQPVQDVVSTTDLVNWQIERPRAQTGADAPGMAAVGGRLIVITGRGTSSLATYRTVP